MENGTRITDSDITKKIEPYLKQATTEKVRCIDERPEKSADASQPDGAKGVQFPGGYYGIIDAIKALSGCTEEEARQRAREANIPLGIHDDEHHGILGCGYGKLVQTEPTTVLAPEAVDVTSRFDFVTSQENHEVFTLIGEHNPTYALINHREGKTIHSAQAVAAHVGSFNYDYWAALKYGSQLRFDPQQFADHMLAVYQKTVIRLTNGAITTFYIIR